MAQNVSNTKSDAESSAPVASVQALEERQDTLTDAIVALAATTSAIADSTIKRVPLGKYKTKTPWNPEALPIGHEKRTHTRRYFQSGALVNPEVTSYEETAELNKLKPGRYFDNFVTVQEVVTGTDTQVHIMYPSKTNDQRMQFKSMFRNFHDLLKQINEAYEQKNYRPL